jgi:hypothetical protein
MRYGCGRGWIGGYGFGSSVVNTRPHPQPQPHPDNSIDNISPISSFISVNFPNDEYAIILS